EGPLGVIPNGAVGIEDERIVWIGPEAELPPDAINAASIDAGGGVVMPGLVDAHTHLVHGGWRDGDFVRRARGEGYRQIAGAGGGILATVRATREAGEEELLAAAVARAAEAFALGTTTIEVKSGYGLDVATELKMLRVVRALQERCARMTFVPTCLGAHVVPEEFQRDRAAYVRQVTDELLPAVAAEGLAECCDVFVEEGAFTADEARAVGAAARQCGLGIRLHVDQFHDGGGGTLAAELGAASADHLDHVSDAGIAAMAARGVVAGLLPGASFFVPQRAWPPVAKLVAARVPIAVATDYNPGTSPTLDLFLCGTIAVTQMGLPPDLALLGMTRVAARALGRAEAIGALRPGAEADLIVLGCVSEYFPLYRFGHSSVRMVIGKGEPAWESPE
ncbi:MAG: imidazolonepropionase, partial [Deltaproteobacteria bacterium]|nr:imidazolonepropionase [Deltaproteobacteria bacterium]